MNEWVTSNSIFFYILLIFKVLQNVIAQELNEQTSNNNISLENKKEKPLDIIRNAFPQNHICADCGASGK